MRLLTSLPTKKTVTNTTMDYTTPLHKIAAKSGQYIILSEISLGFDTVFLTYGYVQIKINGVPVTEGTSEMQFLTNYTFDLNNDKLFIGLEPGGSVEIFARSSSGTGSIQTGIIGMECTPYEYELLRKKHLGLASWMDDLKIILMKLFNKG